jgi:hypothetical protein
LELQPFTVLIVHSSNVKWMSDELLFWRQKRLPHMMDKRRASLNLRHFLFFSSFITATFGWIKIYIYFYNNSSYIMQQFYHLIKESITDYCTYTSPQSINVWRLKCLHYIQSHWQPQQIKITLLNKVMQKLRSIWLSQSYRIYPEFSLASKKNVSTFYAN